MEREEIEQIAHVNDEGRPLCNQVGEHFHLCEPDEFERLPNECRCGRCERFLRDRRDLNPLTNSQQQLLAEITRKTPEDYWYPVTDLCKRKTEAELTSLNRSLRRLEVQGLVEMRTDNHNESFVRLSNKGNSTGGYLLDVYQIDC